MCDYEIRLSLHNFLVYRTVFCRHTGVHSSCVLNALQGFGDSALYGVMLQLFVVFLKFLRSKVLGEAGERPQDLLVRLLSRANFRFPLFLGLLVGGYKAVLCCLRCLRGEEDRWNALVAGSLSGLYACRFLTPKSRELLGLFLLALAVRSVAKGILAGPDFRIRSSYSAYMQAKVRLRRWELAYFLLLNVIIVPTYVLHRRKYLGRPGPVKREAETVLEAAERWLGGVIDELVPLY